MANDRNKPTSTNDEIELAAENGGQFSWEERLQLWVWLWLWRSCRLICRWLLERVKGVGWVRSILSRQVAGPDKSNVTVDGKAAQRRYWYSPFGWGVAATAAILSIVFFVGFAKTFESASTIATAANESRIQRLEDGSLVSLQPRSKLRVKFAKDHRVVQLLEGEATFDVAADTLRPFTVRTFLIDATALGTKFTVSVDTGVTVRVHEGTVEVLERGEAEPTVITLTEGERHRASPDDGFGRDR